MLRGLTSFFASTFAFLALTTVPIGNFMTILALAPFLTTLASAPILGQPFTLVDGGILVTNLVGVAFVANPAATGVPLKGTIYALLVALSMSAGSIITRKGGTSLHYILIVLAIGLAGLPAALVVKPNTLVDSVFNNYTGLGLMMAGCVISFTTAVSNSRAMQVVRPGLALVIRSCSVPVAMLLGLVFLAEKLTVPLLIGASLVSASICVAGYTQLQAASA